MKVELNKDIYPKKAVKRAISDYSHLADLEFTERDSYYMVSMNNIDPDVQKEIKDEFLNYVLSLIKND